MPKLIKKLGFYLISPEKMIQKIVGLKLSDKGIHSNDEKFNIDASGTVTLNRRNQDVQRAFATNVAGLSTKNKG
jgi:multisubunit Na+/H+ antiporter MnhC subunit